MCVCVCVCVYERERERDWRKTCKLGTRTLLNTGKLSWASVLFQFKPSDIFFTLTLKTHVAPLEIVFLIFILEKKQIEMDVLCMTWMRLVKLKLTFVCWLVSKNCRWDWKKGEVRIFYAKSDFKYDIQIRHEKPNLQLQKNLQFVAFRIGI